mgnify:FL=1
MTLRTRAVDAVFGALEFIASLYDLARKFRRAPGPKHDGDTEPVPLTRRSVDHIQDQIRRATATKTGPIPRPPRVPRI